jgi:hypothetical protein
MPITESSFPLKLDPNMYVVLILVGSNYREKTEGTAEFLMET